MRLLRFEKYRNSSIRIYLKANMQHACKIKLPSDSRYYDLGNYPYIDSVDNLLNRAKNEIQTYVDENGIEYE